MSLRFVESKMASETIAIGLTVGWRSRALSLTLARKAVGAGVVPDVRAIAPKAAELNIVEVRVLAVSKHEHEFMPGTVQRAHAAIALDPNTHVEQIEASGTAGGKHLAHVAPIHAGVDDGAPAACEPASSSVSFRKRVNSSSVISPEAIANSRCLISPLPQT